MNTVLTYAGVTKKPSDVLTWLDFVNVMYLLNSPASTLEGPTKGESRSEDEAKGNTACVETGDAVIDALSRCIDNAKNVSVYKTGLAQELVAMLNHKGFAIVRLKDTRNGVYNTRTEKDTD